MNGPDVLGAEQVRQVGRDGGESASIHSENHAKDEYEERHVPGAPSGGSRGIQQNPQSEKDEVGSLPADVVRERRPANPSRNVEQAEQSSKTGAHAGELRLLRGGEVLERSGQPDQPAAENLLDHHHGGRVLRLRRLCEVARQLLAVGALDRLRLAPDGARPAGSDS